MAFCVDGQLVFRCFANGHFISKSLNLVNPFPPTGPSWSSNLPEQIQNKIHVEIQRLLKLLNMRTGAYNFDIQIDDQVNIYLLDMGARNGSNLIPNVTKYATGLDMIEYTINVALGEDCCDLKMVEPYGNWPYYLLNSQNTELLKGLRLMMNLRKIILLNMI